MKALKSAYIVLFPPKISKLCVPRFLYILLINTVSFQYSLFAVFSEVTQ